MTKLIGVNKKRRKRYWLIFAQYVPKESKSLHNIKYIVEKPLIPHEMNIQKDVMQQVGDVSNFYVTGITELSRMDFEEWKRGHEAFIKQREEKKPTILTK